MSNAFQFNDFLVAKMIKKNLNENKVSDIQSASLTESALDNLICV